MGMPVDVDEKVEFGGIRAALNLIFAIIADVAAPGSYVHTRRRQLSRDESGLRVADG